MTKTNKLISIICPVYNSASFLDECIFSVIYQTCSNWELILVDDGSTDGSSAICDKFSSADNRIKTIHKNNNGQMFARIDGIQKSSGEYIMFLDSDDVLEKNAVQVIADYLANCPDVDAVVFNADVFPKDKNNKSLPRVPNNGLIRSKESIIKFTFGDQMLGYLWMYCFKKSIIELSLIISNEHSGIRYTEDGLFIYKALQNVSSLLTADDSLYLYRNNDESITHNLTLKDRNNRFVVFDYIYTDIFTRYKGFIVENKLAVKLSWSLFSLLIHTNYRDDFDISFNKIRKSILFNKVCKKAKSSQRIFNTLKLLLMFGFKKIFFSLRKKLL